MENLLWNCSWITLDFFLKNWPLLINHPIWFFPIWVKVLRIFHHGGLFPSSFQKWPNPLLKRHFICFSKSSLKWWKMFLLHLNPLCTNPTKWPNTLKQFVGKMPTNCLSAFHHFVKLALKGLKALFVLRRFKFLSWIFGNIEKAAWLER